MKAHHMPQEFSTMPFKSEAQKRYLFSQKPEVAKEFEKHTPKKAYKKLPDHVNKATTKEEHMKNVSLQYMRSRSK